eukprot:TRINITY_DN84_c0_g1_i1.p1 TRINITY_DN84_c0_g1~~TRINITY_DN84_c0_g1_i1.p1  ORF type:complete len:176 (-),score=3.94 TRINITY_DN84_c0_g1_i1:485-1012(-)
MYYKSDKLTYYLILNILMRLCLFLILSLVTFSLGLRLRKKARWSTYDLKIKDDYLKLDTYTYIGRSKFREKGPDYGKEITAADISVLELQSNECACIHFTNLAHYSDVRYCLCMQSNGNLVIYRGKWPETFSRFTSSDYNYCIVSGACWSSVDSSAYEFSTDRHKAMITKAGSEC